MNYVFDKDILNMYLIQIRKLPNYHLTVYHCLYTNGKIILKIAKYI